MMTPAVEMLFWLLAVHALCDYPLQGEFLSRAKRKGAIDAVPWYHALTAHALIQGGGVALVTGSVSLGIAETTAHWAIDYGKCSNRFGIHVDQGLHVTCKVVWVLFLFSRRPFA